jgi:hypothetical protein
MALGQDQGLRTKVDAGLRWKGSRPRRGALGRYLAFGRRPEPMPSFLGTVEDPQPGKRGICCSGGGIRSAAFNLGALQSLQRAGELRRANYLAAVSGGSYIAAAFSMVAKAWPASAGGRPASPGDGHDDSDPQLLERCRPFAPGSPEEQYLRNRSSYLAPDGTGKLFLAYRVVLGLLFNLFFVSLPLFGTTLLVGEVFYRPLLPKLIGDCKGHCSADIPRWFWIVPLAVLAASLALAVWGMIRRSRTDQRSRFLEIWSTRTLIAAGALAALLVALPALVEAVRSVSAASSSSGAPKPGVGATGGAVGVAGLATGVLLHLRQAFATPRKAIDELNAGQRALRRLSARARPAAAYAAGALLGPALLLAVVVFALSFALTNSGDGINWWVMAGGAGALGLFGFFYLVADITAWSLHPFYKRRLCTAFALKRVRASELTDAELDRVQPAPGVQPASEDVGVALERDFDRLVQLSDTALRDGDEWPTLLVCAAANVSDPGATPPGRHVTSFTFSAQSIGGPLVGGAPTTRFEQAFRGSEQPARRWWRRRVRRVRDFSLPAAVAMSGAAISPSMGKMTRRPLTFLLALANVRLGVWVPNPRWVTGMAAKGPGWSGRPRPWYLLLELLGRNRVDARYLYVTDGGHYENLGLVELLRRGCTDVYCFDASGGHELGELGDAIALARSELDVQIDIEPGDLAPSDGEDGAKASDGEDEAKADVVQGSFTYRDGTRGRLVYARNVLTEDSPWDAKAYHQRDPAFPHNPTVDQLYTDQKFEGYRVLGELAGRHAVAKMNPARTGASEDS